MKHRNLLFPVVVFAALAGHYLSPPPASAPDQVPLAAPPPALADEVAPIRKLLAGQRADARRLAAFYRQMADVVRRDTTVVTSTGALRTGHRTAGKLMFEQTGIDGRYARLPTRIDQALAKALGLDDVPLTKQKRAAAVTTFEAIAWAAQAAGQ